MNFKKYHHHDIVIVKTTTFNNQGITFLFFKGCRLKKGHTVPVLCSHSHSYKKKKKKKNHAIPSLL